MSDKQFRRGWLRVAKAFGSPSVTRGEIDWIISSSGLCWAWEKATNWRSNINMSERLHKFGGTRDVGCCWFSLNGSFDDLRCLFACLFSNMTVKEFEEICG